MLSIFFTYFSVLILLLVAFYFIGSVLFKVFNLKIESFFTDAFAKVFTATTLYIVISAIYFTHGVTVLIFLLPMMLILLWINKKKEISSKQIFTNELNKFTLIIAILIATVLIFSFRYGQIYNPSSINLPIPPHVDYVFYGNCINFFTHFGYENCSLSYMYPNGVNPYHYYDLWLTAGIAELFHLNVVLTYVMITNSIAGILMFLGFCAILNHYKNFSKADLIFCLLALTISGISFDFYRKVAFMEGIEVYTLNFLTYSKLFPLYIFSIAAILFFINKKENAAIVCILCLPIVFISSSIGVLAAVGLYIIYTFFRTKKINFIAIANLLFITLSVFLFYKINEPANTHVSTNFNETLQNLTDISFLKTIVNIYGGTIIQHILIFAPFVLFFIYNKKDLLLTIIKSPIFFFFVVINFISISAWGILHDKLTTIQLFQNYGAVSFTIFSFYLMMLVWIDSTKRTWFNYIIFSLLFLLGIKRSFQQYRHPYEQSDKYISEIINNESGKLSLNGAFMFTTEDNKKASFGFITNFNILGNYLVYAKNKTFPASLSVHNFEFSTDKHLSAIQHASIKNAPFYMYVEKQKQAGTFKSIELSQIDFVDEYKINYLITSKDVVLPELLKNRVKKLIVDENTGERFYLL